MLDALKATVAIAAEKDVLNTFGAWESGIYGLRIEQAYLDITASGAWMFYANMVGEDGRKITFSECVASNKTGTLKTTYTCRKSGNEIILPGYAKVLNLVHIAVDPTIADISTCEVATKAIKVRQKGADGQMVDAVVEKPVFVDLIGKNIHAGIQKEIQDKFKKNDATGKYDVPNGTREENSFEKFFNEDKQTLQELTAGLPAKFHEGWAEAYAGKTRDRSKNKPVTATAGTAGAPAMGAATPTTPLSYS